MIKSIETDLCNGCGVCVLICPMDVIRLDEKNKKAYIAYVEDCQSCLLCEVECPMGAIYVSAERASSEAPVSTAQ